MNTEQSKKITGRHCMVVHAYYPIGETRVEREAQALLRAGFEVDVICLRYMSAEKAEPESEIVDGVQVYRLPVKRDKRRGVAGQMLEYLSFFFLVLFKLTSLHIKQQYTSVQAHNLPDFLVFAALWPKLTGAKVILDIHDVMPEFFALRSQRSLNSWFVRPILWEEKLSCWFADHVVIATHRWRNTLIGRGVRAEKISVVMNVADERVFIRPSGIRRHRGGNDFRMLYHGTITPRYGVDLAIQSLPYLRDNIPGIRLTLVGGGDYLQEAKDLVAQLKLENHVEFIGIKPAAELPDLILQADIGVTDYRMDGFTDGCLPTKLLEYTAMGIPTVASPTAVITDYFDNSMIEYCAPSDPKDLADHVYLLYSNPDRYNEIARNTANFSARYNWTKLGAEYAELVASLTARR